MALEGRIDTSGATPVPNVERIVSALLGTVAWGWWTGAIGAVQQFADGVWSTLDGLAQFLGVGGVLTLLLDIPVNALEAAARENARFLSGFGVAAQAVAVVEGIVVLTLIMLVLEWSLTELRRAV